MSFIFMLFFIALVTLWVFSFIGLVNPKKWQRLQKNKDVTRKDVFIGCIAGSAILIIVMVVTAPDPETSKPTKQAEQISDQGELSNSDNKVPNLIEQIKSYDKVGILAVRTHGENVLEIDLDATGGAYNNAWYLDASVLKAKDILVKIIKNNPNGKFNVVRFIVIGKLTDQYNKSFESPLFQLTYDLNEIKKINLDNGYVDSKMFLNFSKFGMRHPTSHSIYSEWCEKESNSEQSGNFCQN